MSPTVGDATALWILWLRAVGVSEAWVLAGCVLPEALWTRTELGALCRASAMIARQPWAVDTVEAPKLQAHPAASRTPEPRPAALQCWHNCPRYRSPGAGARALPGPSWPWCCGSCCGGPCRESRVGPAGSRQPAGQKYTASCGAGVIF